MDAIVLGKLGGMYAIVLDIVSTFNVETVVIGIRVTRRAVPKLVSFRYLWL